MTQYKKVWHQLQFNNVKSSVKTKRSKFADKIKKNSLIIHINTLFLANILFLFYNMKIKINHNQKKKKPTCTNPQNLTLVSPIVYV